MFRQDIPPQLLLEAQETNASVKKVLIDRLGENFYNTLTWGAAIGAFIGPAKAFLANQPVEATPENYILLATALAATAFENIRSSVSVEDVKEKLKEAGKDEIVDVYEKSKGDSILKDTVTKTKIFLEWLVGWLPAKMGQSIEDVLKIGSFTAFFTPIVHYISSLSGAVEQPDLTQALTLLLMSGAAEAVLAFLNFLKGVAKNKKQKKAIETTLARVEKAREEEESMDVQMLKEIIEEVKSEKSMLLETPDHDEQVEVEDTGEGWVAKSQLHNIMGNAQYLHDLLASDADLPEGVESKITKAADYLTAVKDHLSYAYSGPNREIDQHQMMAKEDALSMVDSVARRVECPDTKRELIAIVDKLRHGDYEETPEDDEDI